MRGRGRALSPPGHRGARRAPRLSHQAEDDRAHVDPEHTPLRARPLDLRPQRDRERARLASRQASRERLAEITGDTDSELLFAWMLTRLDEVGATSSPASGETDRAIGAAARAARERPGFGAFNFLLSDGTTTYAHRFGRSMFLLERHPEDARHREPQEPGRDDPRDPVVAATQRRIRRIRANDRRAVARHRRRHAPSASSALPRPTGDSPPPRSAQARARKTASVWNCFRGLRYSERS